MERRKYAVIGGDMRNLYLAELLKRITSMLKYMDLTGAEKHGLLKIHLLIRFLTGYRLLLEVYPFNR